MITITSENEIRRFVLENPKYREILKRAVEYEEEHAKEEHFLGWQWSDVRAYPAELMKLIREGTVDIRYKSRRYTHYLLSDKDLIKNILE